MCDVNSNRASTSAANTLAAPCRPSTSSAAENEEVINLYIAKCAMCSKVCYVMYDVHVIHLPGIFEV